ncbi:MAG: hypothetical protein AAF420_11885, partial [Pseudomonadota bacterium]
DQKMAERLKFRNFVIDRYRPALHASLAVVVDDSLSTAALADLYLLVCNLPDTELFDQYDQALKWLMRKEFAGHDALEQSIVGM